jgi:hypothetical protein
MIKIKAYKTKGVSATVLPLSVKREWMDETWEAHAYKCFPVSLTNQMGWGISFPEDITFIWDGISDSTPDHVKILSGEKYAYAERSNATVSFNTGTTFKTDDSYSLLTMPVPNNFTDGYQPFTTIMSSSFYSGDLSCAIRVTRPNVEITIKANTPVFCIVPIDLASLQDSEIEFFDSSEMPPRSFDANDYSKAGAESNGIGKWTNFYRNATDHLGNSLGKHQVKAIRLRVIEGNNQ